jgi:hypothetical protein
MPAGSVSNSNAVASTFTGTDRMIRNWQRDHQAAPVVKRVARETSGIVTVKVAIWIPHLDH